MAPRKKTEAAVKGQETAAALTVQEKEEKAAEAPAEQAEGGFPSNPQTAESPLPAP